MSCGHWEHYHRASDTPDKLNYDKIGSILHLVVDVCVQAERNAMTGPFEGYDTLATEIEFMNRAFGPVLSQFGWALEKRSDVDQLVQFLLSAGL